MSSSFSTLRRCSSFIHRFHIKRSLIRHSSTSSSSFAASQLNRNTNPHHSPGSGLGPTWAWAIGAATGLGFLLHCVSKPDSQFDFGLLSQSLPFVDWRSTPEDEALTERCSTPSFFEKFALPESSGFLLLKEAYRRKVFFNYEKRIRLRSPPEKVFEYFASYHTPEGELLMKPADLMRAVVPVFPPSESHLVRDGYLKGERSPGHLRCAPSEFFMLFDINGDGLISFKEGVL